MEPEIEEVNGPVQESMSLSETPIIPDENTPNEVPMQESETTDPHPQDENAPSKKNTGVPQYRTKYIMSGHSRSIASVKFSPDGTKLASCCEYFPCVSLRLTYAKKLLTSSSRCGMSSTESS